MKQLISVIVPCYNEQDALPLFYKTVIPYLEDLDLKYELILVDDGSKDKTSLTIKELAKSNDCVKYVIFSRNFGKEAAMYAGLEHSKGDYVAIMDADLQDPPSKLKEMYTSIKTEGYDCVATRRVTRKGEPKIRSWFARKFYKIVNKWTKTEIVDGARDYRLMTRQMVDSILSLKEYNRFSKGIFSWVGYKTKWLEYENIERCAGETKWNFKKLFKYAVEGIVAFTLEPLYLIVKLGVGMFILDILSAIVLGILQLCKINVYHEWVILLITLALLVSILIVCIGISAIYQAKSYAEIKKRPIYIAKEEK